MIIIVRTRAINRVIPIYYSIPQPLYLMMSYRKEELYRIMGPTEAHKRRQHIFCGPLPWRTSTSGRQQKTPPRAYLTLPTTAHPPDIPFLL